MPTEGNAVPFGRRRIARTDLAVTEYGIGSAAIAGLFEAVPEEQGRATIRAALDAGIGYVDTAPFYGYGKSEHLVGDVLRHRRGDVVLSSKVGRVLTPFGEAGVASGGWVEPLGFAPHFDYSYDGIMRSFADSQQRLGLNRIDILYVHDIGIMAHGAETHGYHWSQLANGGYRALSNLKAAGSIKAIGIGVNEWEVLVDALDLGDWDTFLLAGRYTLLDQAALSPLLGRCVEHGTSVVIGGVFNSGVLMGNGRWNYAEAPESVLARVRKLKQFCGERQVPLGAAALQMPLSHPAVASVLLGPRSLDELSALLAWSQTPIADAFWTDLAAAGVLAAGTPLPGGVTAE